MHGSITSPTNPRRTRAGRYINTTEQARLAGDLLLQLKPPEKPPDGQTAKEAAAERRKRDVALLYIGLLAYNVECIPDLLGLFDELTECAKTDPQEIVRRHKEQYNESVITRPDRNRRRDTSSYRVEPDDAE